MAEGEQGDGGKDWKLKVYEKTIRKSDLDKLITNKCFNRSTLCEWIKLSPKGY